MLLSACTTAPTTYSAAQYDIARMVPDCNNKNMQIRYLESQLAPSLGVNDPRSYRATVLSLIWEIRQKCQ